MGRLHRHDVAAAGLSISGLRVVPAVSWEVYSARVIEGVECLSRPETSSRVTPMGCVHRHDVSAAGLSTSGLCVVPAA